MLNAQAVSTFFILFPLTSSPNTQPKKIDNFVLGPLIHKAATEKTSLTLFLDQEYSLLNILLVLY